MVAGGSRRKKLTTDRLELLKARTAVGLGFASVAQWEDSTTQDERAQMMALAWLDGWGVGGKYVAAKIHNVNCLKAEDMIQPDDMIEPPQFEHEKPACDWQAAEAMWRSMILKGRSL